jgi:signal transduction histidine kinase
VPRPIGQRTGGGAHEGRGTSWGGVPMRRSWRASPLAVGVAAVVAAASVAGFVFFEHSNGAQEDTLLKSDAGQAALYVGSIFSGLGSTLDPLATAVSLSGGSVAVFDARAKASSAQGLNLVMAQRQGGAYVVEAASGSAYHPGETLDATTSATLARAGASVVAGPVTFDGRTSRSFFAVGPPLAPAGTAIFLEFSLDPFVASPLTAAKPFSLLKVALYGSPTPAMAHLLVATARPDELPLTGATVTDTAQVEGSTWALVAEARSPLIGPSAWRAPYVILGLGLFLAALVGTMVEVLDRRRRYASALVAERTADLEATLGDLRSAQDALIRSERLTALGEMASVVGHELRNPLAAVTNALYLLRRLLGEATDPAYERHLAMAERETAKAVSLADDLTAFVRVREPNKEEVEVASVVDEVLEATAAPPGVAVEVDVDRARVVADRIQLAEVLTNLLTNALQAVGEEGRVRIAADGHNGTAELSVEDSGPGIDPAAASRLFEPFFTTKHDGTGLGLAIVQRLVEANGGTVAFSDRAAQGGARVVVRLPAAPSGEAS